MENPFSQNPPPGEPQEDADAKPLTPSPSTPPSPTPAQLVDLLGKQTSTPENPGIPVITNLLNVQIPLPPTANPGTEAVAPKNKGLRWLLLGIITLVVLASAAAAIYFKFGFPFKGSLTGTVSCPTGYYALNPTRPSAFFVPQNGFNFAYAASLAASPSAPSSAPSTTALSGRSATTAGSNPLKNISATPAGTTVNSNTPANNSSNMAGPTPTSTPTPTPTSTSPTPSPNPSPTAPTLTATPTPNPTSTTTTTESTTTTSPPAPTTSDTTIPSTSTTPDLDCKAIPHQKITPDDNADCSLIDELYNNQPAYILNDQTKTDLQGWYNSCHLSTSTEKSSTVPNRPAANSLTPPPPSPSPSPSITIQTTCPSGQLPDSVTGACTCDLDHGYFELKIANAFTVSPTAPKPLNCQNCDQMAARLTDINKNLSSAIQSTELQAGKTALENAIKENNCNPCAKYEDKISSSLKNKLWENYYQSVVQKLDDKTCGPSLSSCDDAKWKLSFASQLKQNLQSGPSADVNAADLAAIDKIIAQLKKDLLKNHCIDIDRTCGELSTTSTTSGTSTTSASSATPYKTDTSGFPQIDTTKTTDGQLFNGDSSFTADYCPSPRTKIPHEKIPQEISEKTPSPNPNPNPTPEPTPSPLPNPSVNPDPTPSPGPNPNPAPTPTPNPSPNPTPGPSPPPIVLDQQPDDTTVNTKNFADTIATKDEPVTPHPAGVNPPVISLSPNPDAQQTKAFASTESAGSASTKVVTESISASAGSQTVPSSPTKSASAKDLLIPALAKNNSLHAAAPAYSASAPAYNAPAGVKQPQAVPPALSKTGPEDFLYAAAFALTSLLGLGLKKRLAK